MAQSVKRTVSALFAAGLLVHISFFRSVHHIITCDGPDCGTNAAANIRGTLDGLPVDSQQVGAKLGVRGSLDGGSITNEVQEKPLPDDSQSAVSKQVYIKDEMNRLREEQEPVHLVYASDDASIPGVVQSIKSVMHYASRSVIFHFVGDSPLPLRTLPNVKFYNITQVDKQFKLKDFTNPRKRREKDRKTLNSSLANYVRFIMDSLLPEASKAMWIDADTIVKCDIVPMIKNTFQKTNHTIAAVVVKGKPQGLRRRIKKEFDHIKSSFNAGVFVADLDRWRQEKLTDKIRTLTLSNRKDNLYQYGSQPPLTMVIGNDFEHLNPSWNVKVPLLNRYFKDYGNDADICLLHWVGGSKPWEGHGQVRDWWNHYDKEVNRKKMVEIAEKNRAEKARKWKAKLAAKKEKQRLAAEKKKNRAAADQSVAVASNA